MLVLAAAALAQYQHTIHFDLRIARQLGHTDGGPGRIRLLKVFRHNLIHGSKVAQVGEETAEVYIKGVISASPGSCIYSYIKKHYIP